MSFGRYESSEGSNVGIAVTFFLIGLGAGALAALVLAPKTGKQFRRDLKRGYEDARETVQDWTEEARERVRDAKERVRDAAERGAELANDLRADESRSAGDQNCAHECPRVVVRLGSP